MSSKGNKKSNKKNAGAKIVQAIKNLEAKKQATVVVRAPKKKAKLKNKGPGSGFSLSKAPNSIATTINLGGRPGQGGSKAATRMLFPFRECIMPNVQTTGSTVAGGLLSFGDTGGGAQLQLCNIDFNPLDTITFGTRLTNEANNWEYFRFKQLKIMWVTTQNSSTSGQVVLAYDYDPVNPTPPGNIEGYRYFTQLENSMAGSVWECFELQVKVIGRDKYPVEKFFTDLNRIADIRQAVQGQLYVVHGSNLPASTKLGQVWIEGYVEFSERVYRPAAQPAGIQGTGITLPIAGAGSQNAVSLPNGIYTAGNGSVSQVQTANDGGGAAILLAPGTYLSDMSVFLAPSTSNSAGSLLFGTSQLFSSSNGLSSEIPVVVNKRSDASVVAANAAAQSFASSKQEILQVPFPGAYYRPLLQSPTYVGTANPTTITINLSQIASSLLGFLTGLFASPLTTDYADYLWKEGDAYFKAHGNMIGYQPTTFLQFKMVKLPIKPDVEPDYFDFCKMIGLDPSLTSTQETFEMLKRQKGSYGKSTSNNLKS